MQHQMHLNQKPFQAIKAGKQTIEVRLCDEKRSRIKTGDTIVFESRQDASERITVEVIELLKFASFRELYSNMDLADWNAADYTVDQAVECISKYYSPEDEKKFGALGIRVITLRDKLQEFNGPNLLDEKLIKNIVEKFGERIELIQVTGECCFENCFSYAFSIKGLDIFSHLVKEAFNEGKIWENENGSCVIYFNDDGRPVHAGIPGDDKMVISKWSTGHVWKHKDFVCPSIYGRETKKCDFDKNELEKYFIEISKLDK